MLIFVTCTPKICSMFYILSYNPSSRRFRIDEMGKTIETSDTVGFDFIGSSSNVEELRAFAKMVSCYAGLSGERPSVARIKDTFQKMPVIETPFTSGEY